MKKIFCIAAMCLLLSSPVLAKQMVFVPYAVVDDPWWSGLCIHNLTSQPREFTVAAHSADGVLKQGKSFWIQPYSMKVDLLENFFSDGLHDTRVSVGVFHAGSNEIFKVTLFVGTDTGFSFQNYTSIPY